MIIVVTKYYIVIFAQKSLILMRKLQLSNPVNMHFTKLNYWILLKKDILVLGVEGRYTNYLLN